MQDDRTERPRLGRRLICARPLDRCLKSSWPRLRDLTRRHTRCDLQIDASHRRSMSTYQLNQNVIPLRLHQITSE